MTWKRTIRGIIFVVTISMIVLSTGCNSTTKDESLISKYDAVYSNLVDEESQKLLISELKNAGVKQASIDMLIDSIIKYNNAAGNVLPVQDGFDVFSEDSASAYNADKLERKWKNEYKDLSGRKNCRLTAFEAMGSLIDYDDAVKVTVPLFLVETNDPSVFYSNEDIDKFSVLFNGIESTEEINVDSQTKLIKEYWHQSGILFPDNDKISLITIWFNGQDIYTDNDQYILHCGHAAIMIHTENDDVLLLEKLDYIFPYQLIRFPSEAKALQYVVEFNCGEIEGAVIEPIVFVNDHQLKIKNGLFVY